MEKIWEQEKLEAMLREMLAIGAAESRQSGACFVRRFITHKTLCY